MKWKDFPGLTADQKTDIAVRLPFEAEKDNQKAEKIRSKIQKNFDDLETPNVAYHVVFSDEKINDSSYEYIVRIEKNGRINSGYVVGILNTLAYGVLALTVYGAAAIPILPSYWGPNSSTDAHYSVVRTERNETVSQGTLKASKSTLYFAFNTFSYYSFKGTKKISSAIASDLQAKRKETAHKKPAAPTVAVGPKTEQKEQPAWVPSGVKKRVAVLDFRIPGRAVTDDEVNYITNTVRGIARRSLPEAGYIIMTKENITEMLPPGKILSDCVGECAVETGRKIGADYIVDGEIIKFGDQLRLSFTLHDTRDGNLMSSEHSGGTNIIDLESAMTDACYRLFAPMPGARKQK